MTNENQEPKQEEVKQAPAAESTTSAPASAPTKNGNKNILIIGLVIVVAVVGLLGYSYVTKKFLFTKSGTIDGVKYKTDGKQTTLSSKEGDVTVGDNVSLPKDFPKDIPVHPKGKIGLVTSKTPEATWISLEVKDSLANVKSWYKTESEKKGWKIWNDQDTLLTLANDKYGGSVSFTEDKGTILVNFSTMSLEEVKKLTGINPNNTSAKELEESILNGTYQPPVINSDEASPEDIPSE